MTFFDQVSHVFNQCLVNTNKKANTCLFFINNHFFLSSSSILHTYIWYGNKSFLIVHFSILGGFGTIYTSYSFFFWRGKEIRFITISICHNALSFPVILWLKTIIMLFDLVKNRFWEIVYITYNIFSFFKSV